MTSPSDVIMNPVGGGLAVSVSAAKAPSRRRGKRGPSLDREPGALRESKQEAMYAAARQSERTTVRVTSVEFASGGWRVCAGVSEDPSVPCAIFFDGFSVWCRLGDDQGYFFPGGESFEAVRAEIVAALAEGV